MPETPDPLSLIIALVALGLLPFIAVMVTSFVKLVVVFSLVRNALGVQQIPPTIALNGLALILTVYIMAPVGGEVLDLLRDEQLSLSDPASIGAALDKGKEPFRDFLLKFTAERERDFFLDTTRDLWPPEFSEGVTDRDFLIVIPAFTVSELTRAFEIGFLLYLPFVVIDLIVSNILLAMGMMMVSPMTISLPFKLFLFVMVDGWTRLVHGLVLSYQ
jgi:type III secretion protein R